MAWVNPPTNFTKTVEKDVQKHMKDIAIKLLRDLILQSPVDTGRFRNNWLVGLKSKSYGTLTSTGNVALSRGKTVIDKHKDGAIFISNNLPYAQSLNDGHSSQAPRNFVQKAIKKVLK